MSLFYAGESKCNKCESQRIVTSTFSTDGICRDCGNRRDMEIFTMEYMKQYSVSDYYKIKNDRMEDLLSGENF